MSATLVDWSQPIELDDGRPVRLVDGGERGQGATVYIDGPFERGRDSRGGHWGYTKDGTWAGGSRETHYYVRNANNEEDYNDDFK